MKTKWHSIGCFRGVPIRFLETPWEFPRYLPLAIELENHKKICVAGLCPLVALWLLPVPGTARAAVLFEDQISSGFNR